MKVLYFAMLVALATAHGLEEKSSEELSEEGIQIWPGLLGGEPIHGDGPGPMGGPMHGGPMHEGSRHGEPMHGGPMHGGPMHEGSRHGEILEPVLAEDEKPLVRCKRPICRMFCEHGFQMDKYGCPTCKCMNNPCASAPCTEANEECVAADGCEEMPCDTPKYECVVREPCPMPMCSHACPNGYANNEDGCMTCKCVEDVCEEHACPSLHRCVAISVPACPPGQRCGDKPMCLPINHEEDFHPHGAQPQTQGERDLSDVPQPTGPLFGPLCLFRQLFQTELFKNAKIQLANHTLLGRVLGSRAMHAPHCLDDGAFHPMQCHFPDRQCWCVNDMGQALDGTVRNIRTKDDMPDCAPHKTIMIEGEFAVQHQLENIQEHLEKIKETVQGHLSQWIVMEKEFVVITKIDVKPTRERLINIQFTINHDGKADLTEVERKLTWHLRQPHANMEYLEGRLVPQPESLVIKHHSNPMDKAGDPKPCRLARFYSQNKVAVLVGAVVCGAFLLVMFTAVIVTIARKRRQAAAQFEHKRLSSTDSASTGNYKQNLSLASDMYGKYDLMAAETKAPMSGTAVLQLDQPVQDEENPREVTA